MVRQLATVVALAAFAAAMWFAWLGWDHEYYYVDGIPQGPYRGWQVMGCGAAISAAAVAAQLRLRRPAFNIVLAMAAVIGFALPWSLDAGGRDETGTWVVGLFLLLVGGTCGLTALLSVTGSIARRWAPG